MKKITRTIKKDVVEITMYTYDTESLETMTDHAFEMKVKFD